ncbi:G-type lectin S-receptor-like serine/threonine-protein kinase SD1-1 isoform X2 [Triticum aestivum]|uniref:G-type lectin S-receptor-like serine/threonine-protein kinase SD1-1 isoform X2 n=1 Tax=Triticum aestivum TaxID=4565 RepID=UPI001D007E97|nr:G-type lectin S-receptor-like serine/threonine-protein kinase SD1-1 isoform X2 [Triticum aestivum]XP_044359637.1 G-type lectin S-receptor-like serine/threonine-protein kinase SD1-1 isoform X2 [Triticum aestivum]
MEITNYSSVVKKLGLQNSNFHTSVGTYCPMDFEFQNYTIITSRCKGLQHPTMECCAAFKEFSCPFAAYNNMQSTNCAATMLTYINLHGTYPAGLFDECLVGMEGVSCEAIPAIETGMSNGGQRVQGHKSRNSRQRALWIIAVAAPLLSILMCFICSAIWMRRRRKGKVNLHHQAAMNRPKVDTLVPRLEEKSSECTLFDFCVILHATHNFSKETLLGRGGFGPVYKGQLPDGMEIAVKRLASHSGQGFTEFQNEVELLAKLQHNNLVKLMGCCIQGEERLLVYEYLPNKSLDFFIFDESITTFVDWNKRCLIIEGIAQGLLYLHKHSRLRIIHRDLKASNILLDQDMNPKISDFGLAKNFSSNDTQGSTRRVVGTYGYMSPEYASQGIYSVKSDVFSFGVLLLEILSGKRNSGFHEHEDFLNLLGYSWHLWEGGRCLELLEASIANEVHAAEARRYINIALMCVQEHADDRPTMSNVVTMLNSESVALPEPNHPAYYNLTTTKEDESANVPCSYNGVTITEEPDGR